MANYYQTFEGNLRTGDVAKSSDINHIQDNVASAFKELVDDLHDHEPFLLGSGEEHKNDFLITPAPMTLGRYIDDKNVFEINKSNFENINRYTVKQPINLTKTSLYSIITKLRNTSDYDIPITCEIQELDGTSLRKTSVTIPKNTEEYNCEIVFDLDYYPTEHNISHDDLENTDGEEIPSDSEEVDFNEDTYDEGYEQEESDNNPGESSAGISQVYFVINLTNLNATDLEQNDEKPINFNPETSLGVYYQASSISPEKKVFAVKEQGENSSELTNYNIYYQEIYANNTTYLCSGGTAIINGEKIICLDTHVSVAGGDSQGNVLSTIELRLDGHLHARNSQATTDDPLTNDFSKFKDDLDDDETMSAFPVAKILTYSSVLGYDKEPLIIQSQEQDLLPLSHHERLRRLEKQMDWTEDVALPARIKYSLGGSEFIDDDGYKLYSSPYSRGGQDVEFPDGYYVGIDSSGNPVVRLTDTVTHDIKVTLKESFKKDGKEITLDAENSKNAAKLTLKNMVHDAKKGTLKLSTVKSKTSTTSGSPAKTAKEAKETKYNPWDDKSGNRVSSDKFKHHKREFTVHSGKNGKHDSVSEYPGMTFYVSKKCKMKKLLIPIYEFENLSAMKFIIWKRQETNNKKNVVWFEKKMWTSNKMSLKNAKVKNKHQFIDKGFTLSFGKKGLSLEKGQYVIVCFPIPKSGKGSCFVETYEPKNYRDFLIRYYGAANGSHFDLKTRYPEIWYHPAEATVEEEHFAHSGTATSNAISWAGKNYTRIKSINVVTKGNLKHPSGTSYTIEANVGGGWQELTENKNTPVTGDGKSFKWRIKFKGDGKKKTPTLSYDKFDGFAIKFFLTREPNPSPADIAGRTGVENINHTMCITSKPINGMDVLQQYVGDKSLITNHFEEFEFARVWAGAEENKNLLIDIQGADTNIEAEVGGTKYQWPSYTMHYCDLTLDDFSKTNVDYSHYEESVEYDENNLRFKLDSNHSYNDEDIKIKELNTFEYVKNDIDDDAEAPMKFINNDTVTENQLFAKKTIKTNSIDLTKYTGLKINFDLSKVGIAQTETDSSEDETDNTPVSLRGLGIYISTSEELPIVDGENNVPSNEKGNPASDDEHRLTNEESLPDTIYPGESSESFYAGKIIEYTYVIKEENGNISYPKGYFQYVQDYDEETAQMVWRKQEYHVNKDYKIYEVPKITLNENSGTYEARIELDPDSQILKNVKEIGIISLNDEFEDEERKERKYKVEGAGLNVSVKEVLAISEDYYPIYNPEKDNNGAFVTEWQVGTDNEGKPVYGNDGFKQYVSVFQHNKIPFDSEVDSTTGNKHYEDWYGKIPGTEPRNSKYFSTIYPNITMVSIDKKYLTTTSTGIPNEHVDNRLCIYNNTYGNLTKYKHFGIQIASDCYIPKDAIKINLCSKPNGDGVFASANIPTLNGIYTPATSGDVITLSQVFKKINLDEDVKSISITITPQFKEMMSTVLKNDNGEIQKPRINLFIGKIVLYRAETIPFYHGTLRYKFYLTDGKGKITRAQEKMSSESIGIRKIGAVIDYD